MSSWLPCWTAALYKNNLKKLGYLDIGDPEAFLERVDALTINTDFVFSFVYLEAFLFFLEAFLEHLLVQKLMAMQNE